MSRSDTECDEDLPQTTGLSLQDKGWISPPDSIYDASSADSVSGPISTSNSFTGSEVTEPHPDGHDSKENNNVSGSDSVESESREKDDDLKDVALVRSGTSVSSLSEMNIGVENIKIGKQHQESLLDQEETRKSPMQNVDVTGQASSRVKGNLKKIIPQILSSLILLDLVSV